MSGQRRRTEQEQIAAQALMQLRPDLIGTPKFEELVQSISDSGFKPMTGLSFTRDELFNHELSEACQSFGPKKKPTTYRLDCSHGVTPLGQFKTTSFEVVEKADYDALKAERDELKKLHEHATSLVMPGMTDTSDAYLKINRALEKRVAELEAESEHRYKWAMAQQMRADGYLEKIEVIEEELTSATDTLDECHGLIKALEAENAELKEDRDNEIKERHLANLECDRLRAALEDAWFLIERGADLSPGDWQNSCDLLKEKIEALKGEGDV